MQEGSSWNVLHTTLWQRWVLIVVARTILHGLRTTQISKAQCHYYQKIIFSSPSWQTHWIWQASVDLQMTLWCLTRILMLQCFYSDNCNRYWVKYRSTENRCEHNTSAMNIDRELPYGECLFYRFMKSLGADSGCADHISLFESCAFYMWMMRTVAPTIICSIGLIGNSISLVMLCRGLVETPTNYQVQWLAVVDITFIGTHWFTITLYNVIGYAHFTSDLYWHGIEPVLYVCLYPVWFVARSCTVWLTVFIGVYR